MLRQRKDANDHIAAARGSFPEASHACALSLNGSEVEGMHNLPSIHKPSAPWSFFFLVIEVLSGYAKESRRYMA